MMADERQHGTRGADAGVFQRALWLALVGSLLLPACDQDQVGDPSQWPDPDLVPLAREAPVLARFPDLRSVTDVEEKKRRFFEVMRPIVEAENRRVLKLRELLLRLYDRHRNGKSLKPGEVIWLTDLARVYRVGGFAVDREKDWLHLRRRVDMVPLKLALSQAANESAWGTSRFTRLGNAVFGQWCYGPNCGMTPSKREPGKQHQVASFATVNQSVRSYIHNLNTHPAYLIFRKIRLDQRLAGTFPNCDSLAAGLTLYSERGDEYVEELRAMMRINGELMRPDLAGAEADPEDA